MEKQNRVPIDPELLDIVNGGAFGFDPDGSGTYTMHCQHSGQVFYGVQLGDVIEMAKHGAYLEDTPENELQTIEWARQMGYIH